MYRPAQIVHEAFDGAVRVFEVPKGKEWHYDEDAREVDGYTVMALKYILPASPMPLAPARQDLHDQDGLRAARRPGYNQLARGPGHPVC